MVGGLGGMFLGGRVHLGTGVLVALGVIGIGRGVRFLGARLVLGALRLVAGLVGTVVLVLFFLFVRFPGLAGAALVAFGLFVAGGLVCFFLLLLGGSTGVLALRRLAIGVLRGLVLLSAG
ncbi:hypothetical protein GCM10023321_69830 [Pseudonocardia eucalypti]|uniref:Major facilitator superfamily (MFS) profile domain-containing protein n=1 Tax=Pseudonocardia eucalypti TaxID=648755 RepID=A0ABP9R3Y3_9PSEU